MAEKNQPKEPKEKKEKGKPKEKGAEAVAAEAAPAAEKKPAAPVPPPRLQLKYKKDVVPALMKQFAYKNANQVPRLEKIVLNMGLGEAKENPKIIDAGLEQLGLISGQKAVARRSRKSIANFKLREGLQIGVSVTLRRQRMYEFFDRLVNIALPRVRDFKGIPGRSFDGKGNYTLGVREQIIFPEIDYDKIEKIKGLNVTICTTAKTDEEAKALLANLGMPFRG